MSSLSARIAVALAGLAGTAALGACGAPAHQHAQTSTPASSTATPHSAEDVVFLQNMIPHHQQALQLSALVPERTTNAQLVALAAKIAGEQEPEIQAFRAQLLQWEVTPPKGHPMPMDGMVDQATMDTLGNLRDADFDTVWLQSMIAHHRGAITMARSEIARGRSADVISMATTIATAQQTEIDQMNQMLGG